MEMITLSSSLLPPLPFPSTKSSSPQKIRYSAQGKGSSTGMAIFAARRDSKEWGRYGGGLLVDESMIVLRKRVHEMKMVERNYEPPEDWMEWEKQYYTCYDEFVCKFVGFLQLHLINSRPSVALGMLLLITLSVPVSTVMIALQLIEGINGFFRTRALI